MLLYVSYRAIACIVSKRLLNNFFRVKKPKQNEIANFFSVRFGFRMFHSFSFGFSSNLFCFFFQTIANKLNLIPDTY